MTDFADQPARTVLVADDDPHIRRLIVVALARAGFAFEQATNGMEALQIMRSRAVDLVLLDLMMPILSGWSVLEERSHDAALRKIPVIVVSAAHDSVLLRRPPEGVCGVLAKPFDVSALRTIVEECLRGTDGNPESGTA
ncbi:MAG: response regulator [Thermoanaerobaculia bacterium]